MEYCPLVWMGAAETNLAKLDAVQRRAQRKLGPAAQLPSLASRRKVTALTYLYKLQCPDAPERLARMVPPRLVLKSGRPRTRAASALALHPHPLQNSLKATSLNIAKRSFPHCVTQAWNELPADVFPPSGFPRDGLPVFKKAIQRHCF